METSQNASGNPSNSVSNDGQNSASTSGPDANNDTVSYASYRKAVEEAKKAKQRAAELAETNKQYELDKMQHEGQKDDVIQTLRKQLEEERTGRKKDKENYVWSSIDTQIKRKADKMGCKDSASLMRLIDIEDLSTLEVGDNYQVSDESLENLLGGLQSKVKFDLFGGKTVNVNNPTGTTFTPPKKELKDMSAAELDQLAQELDAREKQDR